VLHSLPNVLHSLPNVLHSLPFNQNRLSLPTGFCHSEGIFGAVQR
jgi:hypothetical protein